MLILIADVRCSICSKQTRYDIITTCIIHSLGLTLNEFMWAPRGHCNKGILVPRVLCHSLTEITEVPGKGLGILQNSHKFRVRYGSDIELTEVPGIVARAYRTHLSYRNDIPVPRVFVALAYRTSRSSWYGYERRTEPPELPRTGINVLQNFQKCLCRVIPEVNTLGMVCAYPTEHNLGKIYFLCLTPLRLQAQNTTEKTADYSVGHRKQSELPLAGVGDVLKLQRRKEAVRQPRGMAILGMPQDCFSTMTLDLIALVPFWSVYYNQYIIKSQKG